MYRWARYSAPSGTSIHGAISGGRLTGLSSPTGHMHRQLGRVDLEFRPAPLGAGPFGLPQNHRVPNGRAMIKSMH